MEFKDRKTMVMFIMKGIKSQKAIARDETNQFTQPQLSDYATGKVIPKHNLAELLRVTGWHRYSEEWRGIGTSVFILE